jgi:hypothetical protein
VTPLKGDKVLLMKKLVSNKGSQEVYITKGNGCVVIRAWDKSKHSANTVSIFDELLLGVIAQLSAIATTQRHRTQRAAEAGEHNCPSCDGRGYWIDGYDNALKCGACNGTGQV